MKTIGIIAEYNPFHSGHRYQLEQVRRRFGADFVAVAMSGDFVQRGEPAVYDKYLRTETALAAGADLVLELPVCFATSSAEDFAYAGVTLLDRLGVVDGLCFGSELGELAPLERAARLLLSESKAYKERLKELLRAGNTYPRARAIALSELDELPALCDADTPSALSGTDTPAMLSKADAPSALSRADEPDACLASPNNILGVEYLKALIRRKSRMQPLTIRREGQGYHDFSPGDGTVHPSASALRRGIRTGTVDYFRDFAPDLRTSGRTPVFADDLSLILNWRLLEAVSSGQALSDFADLSPELAARLSRSALEFETFTGRIRQLKTRQYTYTRVSRALLHLLLGIRDADIALAKNLDYVPYVRILGFRRSAAPLLSEIKKNCPLPLITKTAGAGRILDGDSLSVFRKDLHASHLYQALAYGKNRQPMPNEYTHSVIIRQD